MINSNNGVVSGESDTDLPISDQIFDSIAIVETNWLLVTPVVKLP